MNDSRRTWAMAGILGVLAALAMGTMRLAQSEYRLLIHVTDSNGPLGGVWVAVGEKDILTTNTNGYLEVRGKRHELNSAVVTVTDAQAEGRHLAQSVLAHVSWNPFQTESVIEIKLPVIESSVAPHFLTQLDSFSQADELPKATEQLKTENLDLLVGSIEETELADDNSSPVTSLTSFSLMRAENRNFDDANGTLLCQFAGFSPKFCISSIDVVEIPFSKEVVTEKVADASQYNSNDSQFVGLSEQKADASAELNDTPVTKTVREAQPNGMSVLVSMNNSPLSGAYVYMSRQKDSRVIPLGKTSSAGVVQTQVWPEFFGEKITVVHECCAPKSFSTKLLQKAGEAYKVNLEPGIGFAVLVQQIAYGLLRSTAAFELHGESGKLSVAEQDGLAFFDSGKLPETRLQRVLIRNGLPSEYFAGTKSDQNKLTHVLMAANEPFQPTLAVIESDGGLFHKGVLKNSYLRRWRRDFMARLMQLQSVRTQVSGESEARIKLARLNLSQLKESGWKQTQLNSEWDFLLSIDYSEKDEALELVLTDREGSALLRKKVQAKNALPERVSRSNFEELVTVFPFEAYVLSEAEGVVDLAFTQKKQFGLTSDSRFALYSHELLDSDKLKTELIGFAKVEQGENVGVVKAKVTHMSPLSRSSSVFPSVVRAVKVGPEFYKAELRKNSFAALKKDPL
jgi:hypothetical protein